MSEEPEIWWELYDENHGRQYYYNTMTEQTVWQRPTTGEIVIPDIEEDEEDADEYGEIEEEEEEPAWEEEEEAGECEEEPEYAEGPEESEELEDAEDPDDENSGISASTAVFDQSESSLGSPAGSPVMERSFMTPAPPPPITASAMVAPLPPPIAGDANAMQFPPSLLNRLQDVPGARQSCPPPREYPLAEGWEEFFDKSSSSFFYLHQQSGERTYDRDVACGLLPMVDISDGEDSDGELPVEIPREYPKVKASPAQSPKMTAVALPVELPAEPLPVPDTPAPAPPPEAPVARNPSLATVASVSDVTLSRSHSNSSSMKSRKNKGKKRSSKKKDRAEDQLTPVSRQPTLPSDLKGDINMFQLEGYAKDFFETHKRGLFRRQVPVKEMLCWTKETIPTSLTRLSTELAKEAVKNFKAIQMYSGDRPSKHEPVPLAQDIIGRGINKPELRDEIYCQLSKQSCFNPSQESNHKVWELFVLSSLYFPPSRDLEAWLIKYIEEHLKITTPSSEGDEKLPVFAKYVIKKIKIIVEAGARGRLPAPREIERFRNAPFSHTAFGVTLDDIMDRQRESGSNLRIPQIVITLSEAVRALGGFAVEGIFRVPGDTEQVYALRIQLDKGNYVVEGDDPNTPASLLKLWMRELEDPLVPVELYDECINTCKEDESNISGALEVMNRLPEVNRLTGLYIVHFLKQVAVDQEVNKMSINNLAMVFSPNFLRCPSEDPQVILNNTKYEQAWLRALMNGVDTSVPMELE